MIKVVLLLLMLQTPKSIVRKIHIRSADPLTIAYIMSQQWKVSKPENSTIIKKP